MANKVTIGQVNVRVRPDTSGVYQETKRALDAIEKKLGAIEVEVKADADSLNREVERARDSAQRQARRDAITFRVDLENDESIKRAIGQVRRELERLSEDEFKIDLDHDALNEFLDDLNEQFEAPKVINLDYKEGEAGLRALRREIEKIESEHRRLPFEFDTSEDGIRRALADIDEQIARQPVQLHVEPNVASVDKALREIDRRLGIDGSIEMEVATDEESLRRARHHLEELREDYDDTTLDFHPEVSELAHRLAQGKLAWLARSRIVNLIPLVNSAAARKAETAITALAGVRLLRSTFDRVWDLVKNLDKNIPLIGSIALAVQGLSAWLLAAASNTFALAQSLAQIGPLALTLPGILAGFAFGIGAYVAVLQDFNEVLPEIGDSLSDLQDEMSSRFWEQSAEAVRSSWLQVLPPLRKGLLQTTDALSGWTNAIAGSLGRHLPPTLPEMFDNLSRSIDIASRGADDFGRIIEILGRRGSEYLPRLARWFTDIQSNFANWLDTADRTGRLTRLIEQAIEQASQLGRVFYHTGGILADFAHAAELAGGTSLTDLANKLEQIHEVTSRPSFQAGLVRTFRAAHEAMDNIARVSGPRVHDFFVNLVDMMERNLPLVGETIGLLVGGIAEALSTDRFERGFNDFVRGLNSMARDLDPVWDDIGDGIGSVLSLAGDLATAFGPVLAAAFSLFSDVAQAVAPILGEIASVLSARLVTVIEALHEPIVAIAEAFANLVLAAANVPGLLEGILLGFLALRAIRPIVGILETARRALAVFGIGGKGKGANAAKGGKAGLFGGLLSGLTNLRGLLSRVGPQLLRFGGIIGAIASALIGAWQNSETFRDSISNLWQSFTTAIAPVWDALGRLGDALGKLMGAIGDVVGSILGALAPAFEEIGGYAAGKVADAINLIADALIIVADAISGTVSFFSNLTPRMESFFTTIHDGGGALALFVELLGRLGQIFTGDLVGGVAGFLDDLGLLPQRIEDMLGGVSGSYDAAAKAPQNFGKVASQANKNVSTSLDRTQKIANLRSQQITDSIDGVGESFIDLGTTLNDQEYTYRGAMDELNAQVEAAKNYAENMAELGRTSSAEVVAYFESLGPAGAQFLEDFLNSATPEDYASIEEAWRIMGGDLSGAAGIGINQLPELGSDALKEMGQVALQEGPQVVDKVKQALQGTREAGRQAGSNATQGMQNGINSGKDAVKGSGQDTANSLKQGLDTAKAKANASGVDAATQYKLGVQRLRSQTVAAATSTVKLMVSAFTRAVPLATNAGMRTGMGYVKGLLQAIRQAPNVVLQVVSTIVKILRSGASPAAAAGVATGVGYVKGLMQSSGAASSAAASMATGAARMLYSVQGAAYRAGLNVGYGFAQGIRASMGAAIAAAANMAAAAAAAARRKLDIRSPSRVFREVGEYTGQGFAEGIRSTESEVEKAGRRVAEAAEKGVKSVGDLSTNSNLIIGTGDNRALPDEDRESLRAFIAAAEELSKRPVEAKVNGRVLWKTVKESEVKYG